KQHSKLPMTEVELDAVDLVGLSPAYQGAASGSVSPYERPNLQTSYDEEIAALGMPLPSEAPECVLPKQRRAFIGNRALGIFGFVLITSAGLVAHQVASTNPAPEPVTTLAWTPLPERGDVEALAELEEEELASPTLFANPF